MRITEVEVTSFDYNLDDVSVKSGHQVYDPGSEINPPGFVLTIRTSNGLEGHYRGFMYTPPMISQIESSVRRTLIGEDPLERQKIWQELWVSLRHSDHLGVGPIDIALWDIAGKYYDESVAKLLGGHRDSIPAYASTFWGDSAEDGLSTPDAYANFAEDLLDQGYPAFKIHPHGDPETDIEICREVATRVGDSMDLMLDCSSEYPTYKEAERVGKVLDEHGFFWYEDPMMDTGDSIYAAKRLEQALDTSVLVGEHSRTGHYGYSNYLKQEAVDLLRGDTHMDGGITGVMKIANLAEAFGVDIELHVGGPSQLHCLSAIRNTNYFEHGVLHPHTDWMNDQGFENYREEINDDGTISIPDGPGLGVDIDWDYVHDNETGTAVIS